MRNYVVQRILATVPVMGVVVLFVFLLLRLAPGDPAALADAVLEVLADRERMGAAGRERARRWHADGYARRMAELLRP